MKKDAPPVTIAIELRELERIVGAAVRDVPAHLVASETVKRLIERETTVARTATEHSKDARSRARVIVAQLAGREPDAEDVARVTQRKAEERDASRQRKRLAQEGAAEEDGSDLSEAWSLGIDTPAGAKLEIGTGDPPRERVDLHFPGHELDEVVLGSWFHLEKMDDGAWWMRIGDACVRVATKGPRPLVDVTRGEY